MSETQLSETPKPEVRQTSPLTMPYLILWRSPNEPDTVQTAWDVTPELEEAMRDPHFDLNDPCQFSELKLSTQVPLASDTSSMEDLNTAIVRKALRIEHPMQGSMHSLKEMLKCAPRFGPEASEMTSIQGPILYVFINRLGTLQHSWAEPRKEDYMPGRLKTYSYEDRVNNQYSLGIAIQLNLAIRVRYDLSLDVEPRKEIPTSSAEKKQEKRQASEARLWVAYEQLTTEGITVTKALLLERAELPEDYEMRPWPENTPSPDQMDPHGFTPVVPHVL